MIKEMEILAKMFADLTDGALYAVIAYLAYKLIYLALIVFPAVKCIKFIVEKAFVNETKKD